MTRPVTILDKYPAYEAVIGIEVHVQLSTNTKIFCNCPNKSQQEPNTNICPVCAGYPGTLPVLNERVVDYAILAGLATNCTIAPRSCFDRKHYFYPDLPKGYQITQQFHPICTEGFVEIQSSQDTLKKVRLNRIHIEEDAGKSIHSAQSNESFVDLNRAGTPLLEIVSYPDISDSNEAKLYLKTLRSIVQYLGICTGNMEDGAFRADTNISVRKKGATALGTKCELKNINSFKFIGDAIEYEIERQIELLESGQTVRQETRLWDTKLKQTFVMRVKEEAIDYRYFQDPDLSEIRIIPARIDTARVSMPELPHQKHERLTKEYGLSEYEADILVEEPALAQYTEQALIQHKSKQVVNWILRDVIGYLKDNKIEISQFLISPKKLAHTIKLLETGKINNAGAREIFAVMAKEDKTPEAIIQEKNLGQIENTAELEKIVREIIDTSPTQAAEFKKGNERLMGFFVGQAMKKSQGKGNPQVFTELFKKLL